MKPSTKIILPIIIISALLILLNGCMGTVPDESPGFTPGTITGVIASPCCSTSDEPVSETCCIAPEFWCFYCQNTWDLQDGIKVVLTYGEDEIATTTTNQYGEFTFTDVAPGKNYVVTAYCPDFGDNRPLVKDVALELIEGGSFDTKITDLVSTSLGLVVDFLVLYTEWGPEDISLDEVLADRANFPNFPKFKKLVYEVRRVVENCEVNLLTDDDVQDALCRAAEEISKLEIGCGPGYTPPPPPPPTPDPCDVNTTAPVISKVTLNDGSTISTIADPPSAVDLVAGKPYEICIYATDDDGILSQPLAYSLTINDGTNSFDVDIGTSDSGSFCFSVVPFFGDVGTYEVYVKVSDGCAKTPWGPVTVVVHDECYLNAAPIITLPVGSPFVIEPNTLKTWAFTVTDDNIKPGALSATVSIYPVPDATGSFGYTFDPGTGDGTISWTPQCEDLGETYTITVDAYDDCDPSSDSFEVTLNTEPCECFGNIAPIVEVPDDLLGIFVAAGSTYEADIFMSDDGIKDDPFGYTISILPPVTNPLSITIISGGVHISWNTDCLDIVDGANTEYTITVEAFDGCDTTIKSFTITLLAEPCVPCSLSLQVKEGGKLVEYLDGLSYTTTVSGNITYITYDNITVGTKASKLWFRICASPDAEMAYNFYRGGSCPNKWDYDDGSAGTPPGWMVLDSMFNSQYYPDGYPKPSPDDLIVCNTGDPNEPVNILMVKVTEENLITIYTFNIFR